MCVYQRHHYHTITTIEKNAIWFNCDCIERAENSIAWRLNNRPTSNKQLTENSDNVYTHLVSHRLLSGKHSHRYLYYFDAQKVFTLYFNLQKLRHPIFPHWRNKKYQNNSTHQPKNRLGQLSIWCNNEFELMCQFIRFCFCFCFFSVCLFVCLVHSMESGCI